MSRWGSRWPWLLIAAGVGLCARYTWASWLSFEREAYFLAQRERPYRWVGEVFHFAKKVDGLSGAAAERIAVEAFGVAKTSLERDAAHILLTRVRVQNGGAPEDDLASFLDQDSDEVLWSFALDQLYSSRKERGDTAGAVTLLEDVYSGRIRHPEHDLIPFQYIERYAAWTLAEHFLTVGDGASARKWALRLKYDIAARIDYPCGNGNRGEFEAIEDMIFRAAALSGGSYVKEPCNWIQPARRDFGPPFLECAGGAVLGLVVAFSGICVLTRRVGRWPGRAVGWRFFWTARGPLAQLGWVLLLLAGALTQAGLVLLAFKDAPPLNPEAVLGLLVTAPLYIMPLIALTGCYRAKVTSAGPAWARGAPRGS